VGSNEVKLKFMNKLINGMHENKFILSIIAMSSICVIAVFYEYKDVCDYMISYHISDCEFLVMYLIIPVEALILIILMKLFGTRMEIFNFWERFTFYYLVTYLLIYLLTPADGGFLQPVYKETVCLASLILYPVISLGVILFACRKSN
jgi:hypothetical protein